MEGRGVIALSIPEGIALSIPEETALSVPERAAVQASLVTG